MSAVQLNELMSQHFNDVENLRQARQSDLTKQHDAMLKKLQKRLKKKSKEDGEDEEMKELLDDLKRSRSNLSNGIGCGIDSPLHKVCWF